MTNFIKSSKEKPYLVFRKKYNLALQADQKNIEALCISSYSLKNKEVNARNVNLKFIHNNKFIFFSNYESPKAQDFNSHKQITALVYWNSINVQIRMKAKIKKTSKEYNQDYFSKRDFKKNALSICSHQSSEISSYEALLKKYEISLKNENLTKCPDYWGGFSFIPYYFEFWEGHESRINKREEYKYENGKWVSRYLQA